METAVSVAGTVMVGIVLSMTSEAQECDPAPEFPEWLVRAEVVAEIAQIAAFGEEESGAGPEVSSLPSDENDVPND